MASAYRDFDAPHPDEFDERDELLDGYNRLLRATCGASIGWHRRYGHKAQALEGEFEVGVWTNAGTMTEIQRYVERRTDQDLDVPKFHDDRFTMQLVAVLNALDRDVERALEGGIREEVEEMYLGLRRIKNGE